MKPVWRTGVLLSESHNPGFGKHWAVGGFLRFRLDGCGHELTRKLSQGTPKRFRCQACERLRSGVKGRQRIGDGPWIEESWNDETGLPDRRETKETNM